MQVDVEYRLKNPVNLWLSLGSNRGLASRFILNQDHAGKGLNGLGGYVVVNGGQTIGEVYDGSYWSSGFALAPFEFFQINHL